MLWRQQEDPNRSVSAFTRVMGSTQANRNFLSFSANVGLTYHDPVANRPDDTLAVGLGYAKVSRRVTQADRDVAEGFLQRCAFDDTVSLEEMEAAPVLGDYLASCRRPDGSYVFSHEVALLWM